MPNVTPCPASADLQRYLLGLIPDASASAIDDHLQTCTVCVQSLGVQTATDPLLGVIQNSGRLRRPRNAVIENLVQQLENISRTLASPAGPLDTPAPPAANGETIASANPVSMMATAGPDRVALNERPSDNPKDYLAPAQAPDEMGRLGGYRVLKVLGQGGMGVVFLAEDIALKRRVALKVMRPNIATSAEARQRFNHEAQRMAALEHEHIISIFQVGEERGVLFLAMPLLQGETLEERLRSPTKLTMAEAVRIARETAEGLAAAHDKGLIHRDVKPVNIWLARPLTLPGTPLGAVDPPRVKILDFGLARSLEGDINLTQTGMIVGTPAYMSPEQARSEPLDVRTDLFSLGCVLYRMLTSERPFKGATPMSQLRALELEEPSPPQQVNPQVPSPLSQLTMRLLKKNPAERPPSARAVVKWLAAIEADLNKGTKDAVYPVAIPVSTETTISLKVQHIAGFLKRRRAYVAAAGVLLLVGVSAIVAAAGWGLSRPGPEEKVVVHQPVKPPEPISITLGRKLRTEWIGTSVAETSEKAMPPLAKGAYVAEPLPIKGLDNWTIKTSQFLNAQASAVAFLPDGSNLAILAGSQWLYMNMKTFELQPAPADGYYTTLSPDNSERATISGREVVVISSDIEKRKRTYSDFVTPVGGIEYSRDGKLLAANESDALRIFDVEHRTQYCCLNVGGNRFSWSPDGSKLISYFYNNAVFYLVDVAKKTVKKNANYPGIVYWMQWSPKGGLVASVGSSQKLQLWEVNDTIPDNPVETGLACTSIMNWSPDGEYLAYGNGNKVCVWSSEQQKEVQLEGHTKPVIWASFSPNGQTVVSCSADGTIRFWDRTKGRYLGAIILVLANGHACCLAVSTKGHYSGGADVEKAFRYDFYQAKQAGDLPPEEFFETFKWTNDRTRVKLLAGDKGE